jgi:hypothetical protein
MILALAFLAGCNANPDGPRAPSVTPSKEASDAAAPKPLTKNPREIVGPD